MKRETKISNLPKGSGAALGAFIRALYLTASSRYAIIGMCVNKQGMFEKVGNTTTLVSDIILLFTSDVYTIDDSVVTKAHNRGDSILGPVYEISVPLGTVSEISTDACKTFYTTSRERQIKLTEPADVVLTFYICKVTGMIHESQSSVALADVFANKESAKIIPTTATGNRISRCWSTLEQHKFTEDLTIHFESDNETNFVNDLESLKNLYTEYVLKGADTLNDLSTE